MTGASWSRIWSLGREQTIPLGNKSSLHAYAGFADFPVLVVDDDESFLRVASSVLTDGPVPPAFAVSTVRTGTEAVAFLERLALRGCATPRLRDPRLRLPDIDASAVLARLAADGALRDLPVLVVSQASWEEDEAALREVGATEFHTKPSRVTALREIVTDFGATTSPIPVGMSLPEDELRAGGARLVRGTEWTIVILLGLGTGSTLLASSPCRLSSRSQPSC